MKKSTENIPRLADHYRVKRLGGKKIKIYQMPLSRRFLAAILSLLALVIVGALFSTGWLDFACSPVPTAIITLAVFVFVTAAMVTHFNSAMVLDIQKCVLIINQSGFHSKYYPLETVEKMTSEKKNYLTVYIITGTDEVKSKAGDGYIKQRYSKRVNYHIPFSKSSLQQRRFSVFIKECNEVLYEIHEAMDP